MAEKGQILSAADCYGGVKLQLLTKTSEMEPTKGILTR